MWQNRKKGKERKIKKVDFYFAMLVVLILIFADVGLSNPTGSVQFSKNDLRFSKDKGYDVVNHKYVSSRREDIGAPDLPARILNFLIPNDANVSHINILLSSYMDISGEYYIIPIQPPIPVGDTTTTQFVEPDSLIYNSSSPYPENVIEILGDGYFLGYHVVTIRINPFRYKPVERKLSLYTNVSFSLELIPCSDMSVPVSRRSSISRKAVENTIKRMVENPEDITGYSGNPPLGKKSSVTETTTLTISEFPSLNGNCVDYIMRNLCKTSRNNRSKRGVILLNFL